MIPRLTLHALASKSVGRTVMSVDLIAAVVIPCTAGKNSPEQKCAGLHAAIRGELVRRDASDTQPPYVMLTFILRNDSEKPINTQHGSWKIVIDGKELEDSGFIFGNGPGPVGG